MGDSAGCDGRARRRVLAYRGRVASGGVQRDDPLAGVAHVRVLGGVQHVGGDGAVVDLPSSTQRRVLALLALHPRSTLRPDHLCDVLGISNGALRTTVSRLRARIGEDAIATDALGYRLARVVDAAVFAELVTVPAPDDADRAATLGAALALWHGAALDEFRHEPWAEAEVFRFDELRGLAVEDLAEELVEQGRGREAIAALEAHVAGNPLRDRSRGLLIRALASEGRQADALRAFQEYRGYLAEETGTDPSPEIVSIEHRVAAGWSGIERGAGPTSVPAAPAAAGASTVEVPLHAVIAHGADLIGRHDEVAALVAERETVEAGTLRCVVLGGEAGVGKTTLLGAVGRALHGTGGSTVVYGRCEEDATVPLQPFRSVVGALVDHAPLDLLRAHGGRFGGELARIAPHVANRIVVPPPRVSDDATERYQLFEAIADLLRRIAAERPLVLLLDDLHWAEPTALLLARHLAGALVDAPVLVVASHRDTGEHRSEELRAALTTIERLGARRISLHGFGDAELTELVASVAPASTSVDAAVLAHLRRETAGNPLYAGQLVRHLVESGGLDVRRGVAAFSGPFEDAGVPQNLVDVVWSRVRALGGVAPEVLCTASVLGVAFDEDLLVATAEQGERDVGAALDAAVAAGLLVEASEAPRTLRFTHALVAHALAAELGGAHRRRLHERAAQALEKLDDHRSQRVVTQLARHWARAGDLGAAQRWATVAGDRSLAQLAATEAAAWYRTALEHAEALDRPEAERASLMVRLGTAQHRAGDPATHETLCEGAALAQRSGADDVLVAAALANDRGFMRVGSVNHEQLAILERALAVVGSGDPAVRARLLALLSQELVHTPQSGRRQRLAREAIELLDASDDPLLLPQTISALTFALWGPGTLGVRKDLAARAVEAAVTTGDPVLQFWANRSACFVGVESADVAGVEAAHERMRAIADRLGEPRLGWVMAVLETFLATMAARLDEAEEHAGRVLELGLAIGEPDATSIYAGQLFVIRSFAGRYAEMVPLLEEVVAGDPGVTPFRLAFAISCCAAGRTDDARAVLAEGMAGGFSEIPFDYFWVTTVTGYAVLAIELEDVEAAAQLFVLLEPFGDEVTFSGASSQGHLGGYLGKLASVTGHHDVADAHLRRALEVAVAFGWRYHEATTLVALARSQLRRTGSLDPTAQGRLMRAATIAGECGLGLVVEQVDALRGVRDRGDAPL